jgi:hypothetical protein
MWSRLHRNHVIMAFPSFDTTTNSWAPQADISWCAGPVRESEFVRFTTRATTEDEAVNCALHKGVAWINQRLKHLRSDVSAVHQRRGDVIEALQQHLKRPHSMHSGLLRLTTPASQTKNLTFDQFKSIMANLGLSSSEQSLRKSYDALTKLRKVRHCSWAKITDKMQKSREFLAVTEESGRRTKAPARLPLTPRDWRRIV